MVKINRLCLLKRMNFLTPFFVEFKIRFFIKYYNLFVYGAFPLYDVKNNKCIYF
ncbi:hypothetical protein GCM10028778_16580 [Barrientosiimonas marina]